MTTFYSVDSRGFYNQGKVINPIIPNITPREIQNTAISLFPNGVSAHGNGYFLSAQALASDLNYSIDWGLEFYRRSMHPSLPSRYTSIFACESLSDAIQFRSNYRHQSNGIYEIDCDKERVHRGDMTLLMNNNSVLVYTYHFENYWNGTTISSNPFWEILIPMPVTIGRKVA